MVGSTSTSFDEKNSLLPISISDHNQPLRVDAPGHESLLQRIRELAAVAVEYQFPASRAVPRRFHENSVQLAGARRELTLRAAQGQSIPAESEWLLDNYYIIEEVVREIRTDLPRGYYRELPALIQGEFPRLPRIYPLALTLLAYTDSAISEADIREAVAEYQKIAPLTIGEIWAIPTMLRLALLENLRRVSDQIVQTVRDHRAAAFAIHQGNRHRNSALPNNPSDAFAIAFWEGLRDGDNSPGVAADLVSTWITEHLPDPNQVQQREFRRQAANQVTIGNAITSLRLLGVIDWMVFFESVSLVEVELRKDPGGIYTRQDISTRDRCRRSVEGFARAAKISELTVVTRANRLAEINREAAGRSYSAWYLIDDGRRDLAAELGLSSTRGVSRGDWLLNHPNLVYFGSMTFLTAILVAAAIILAATQSLVLILLVAILALLPASELASGFTNFLVTRLIPPRVLPKLDFRAGIAEGNETFVVIPALIGKPEQAQALCERLELHYLANPDPRLSFALLSDYNDAEQEVLSTDEACLWAAQESIRLLNERHASEGVPRFFLLHRKRLWNPSENSWMGWERKRGKLDEFNRLLRGDQNTSYDLIFPALAALPKMRYVLTLDADTVLPRDAARQLVATLAHPLNHPVLSEDGRRVVRGYGVLQPRVSFLYKAGFRSWFAKLFAGSAGIDPYSSAVSDTYMDLFGQGTFTGKGLYDIDAFHATAGQAFPENTILSHDLIESNYARCGLVTDIEVFDEFPARYPVYARRDHRWIRGDWQLLPWLRKRVPIPAIESSHLAPRDDYKRIANVLPELERWKIIDNLRRSLVPIGLVSLTILGSTVLPGPAWMWMLFVVIVLSWSAIFMVVEAGIRSLFGQSRRSVFARLRADLPSTLGQACLQGAFLANQAWIASDAIARTLYRLFVSRKRLLEWESAAASEKRLGNDLNTFLGVMTPAMAIALVGAGSAAIFAPSNLIYGAPVFLMWFVSPWIAWRVSQPRLFRDSPLTAAEELELRLICRKTWNFFETFVGDADHSLPPDNFQEEPLGVVAHRTSPTNIGLYLLSVLAAHDLGYLTLPEIIDRLRQTFETLNKLESHHGHFLNWYETNTLRVLEPGYVSTVDSGNLLACLLVLKHGLLEKAKDRYSPAMQGLRDTFEVFRRSLIASTAGETKVPKSVLEGVRTALETNDNLAAVGEWAEKLIAALPGDHTESIRWAKIFQDQTSRLRYAAEKTAEFESHWIQQLTLLADNADRLARDMDFKFLYNESRDLFSIGYNCATHRRDPSHYDLLASEACIASFLAVARGEVPRKHWFQLGRLAMMADGATGLISWGGTMFEYLMPRLILPVPSGVLLDRAQRTAVQCQIDFGRETKLPWGISESSFYLFDAAKIYQYQSFGVPGLGLKRGLERDRVVAPYATLMAVDVVPHEALANLQVLRGFHAEGPFGFYEAVDFTTERLPDKAQCGVVRSYMAHHQGMALLSIVNRLTGGIMRRRLHAEPLVRAAELLLEERVPMDAPLLETELPLGEGPKLSGVPVPSRRRITTPDTPIPRTHLLSNGRYSVMLTNAGGGFSRCQDLDISHFRADRTADNCGQFIYLRDRRTAKVWSVGHQPTRVRPSEYEVVYSLDKADIRRLDDGIESHLEITVASDQDVEIRRLTIINHGDKTRELDATSYMDVVLNDHGGDLAHPAFGKLFLETEWLADFSALLCRRRPRSPEQPLFYAIHLMSAELTSGRLSWETERRKFLGRRRTVAKPAALDPNCDALSGTVGPVLDPVFAIRRQILLRPGEKTILTFVTGFAASREAAITLADHYHTTPAITRAFELAWARARIELQHSQLRPEDVHLFQRLAGHLIYPVSPLRAGSESLSLNREGQSSLWRFGISGDLPILMLRLHAPGGMPLLRQLLQAHSFCLSKRLRFDLLVMCENAGGYQDDLFTEAINAVRSIGIGDQIDRSGGVFVRKGAQMVETDRTLLLAAARVVLDDRKGPLASQVDNPEPLRQVPVRPNFSSPAPARFESVDKPTKMQFWNGTGGFTADGLEYVIAPDNPSKTPPLPWSNVIANPNAGFLITDSGGGFAWAGNSQMNRLTPWSNDPVSDPPGEVIYIQAETTGNLWCPTPLPVRDNGGVMVRHGQGYSAFERVVDDISHELTMFVPKSDPVKISVLRLKNKGQKAVRLTLAYFVEWVLGTNREATSSYIVCEQDTETKAIFARNAFNPDTRPKVAFAAVNLPELSITADRTEFLGRNGSTAAPASFERVRLSGRVGPALDPCAALRGSIVLAPKEEREIIFLLGETGDVVTARQLIQRYSKPAEAEQALEEMVTQWDELCGKIQVKSPDPAFDLMMNRWLLYQTLSCRVWGRSAFYQSGGAYGFRDQLQDVAALVHAAPNETRAQILRAAARQYIEGDVQHWWHEPAGNGVRTRFSDDFLWLPYVVCHYSLATADSGIFDERVPFIKSPLLGEKVQERYETPEVSDDTGTIYDHCCRALQNGWKLGSHGLPLMGCGDWNDGMNTIGNQGKGESIWVAWFQIVCLKEMAKIAEKRADLEFAQLCQQHAAQLREAIETHGYDGDWYLRAYFDDGTPIGSHVNDECRFDSIAQSWAVISEVAEPSRAESSIKSVMEHLVNRNERLMLLFNPPFDHGPLQPGYIKGYIPGVRENGGQYTHAATWVVKALAMMGRGDSAFEMHNLLNPVLSTTNAAGVAQYCGEPYVISADVYSRPPWVGRAGWSWYTGSAAWFYRVGLEDILGFDRRGNRLRIRPCLPSSWPEVSVTYHHGRSFYRIEIDNSIGTSGRRRMWLDGVEIIDEFVTLVDDGEEHKIAVKWTIDPVVPKAVSGQLSAVS